MHAGFDLATAASLMDYISGLGADWVYLSPVLAAQPGSTHGYDVVDHAAVDAERGGEEGLQQFASAARAAGVGVLIDIVPNHMGVASPLVNRWWRDVLEHGRGSAYADAFDIDWDAGGDRLRIPVLGDEPKPPLEIVDGELRYYEHRFPVRPDTPRSITPKEAHDFQHYELINWRLADDSLNYRRFFAVNTLAAVRVEQPWVFEATHRLIGRWIAEGVATGLRVDHPDGLAQPGRYFAQLAELTGGAYVVAEKILADHESLPADWQVAGTTGYDELGEIDRAFVDPAAEQRFDLIHAWCCGGEPTPVWEQLVHGTKRAVADGILRSEVLRITRELAAALGSSVIESTQLADGVAELLACFPVYRSYLPEGRRAFDIAAESATRRRPDLAATIDAITPVLTDPEAAPAIRFQQTSGMVMAKGAEDCAFFRFNRLGSLTEVGGNPSRFGVDLTTFHGLQQGRQTDWPMSMTTLSTHDTKRSEDVRARLNVLSEIPDEWEATLRKLVDANPLSDGCLAELLWQSAIGAWPISGDRLHAYAEKAAREAGSSTNWSDPDAEFEAEMHRFVEGIVSSTQVRPIVERFVDRIAPYGWSNSLSAKLVQLAAPGVPDVYQGSELWDFSLTDPDNRRPVDYAVRRELLRQLDAGWLPPVDAGGAAKLMVTSRALRLRRDRPELFGGYVPLMAEGLSAEHMIGFDRGGAITIATRLPVILERAGGWGDTTVTLPDGEHHDQLTGRSYDGGSHRLANLLAHYPVALLAAAEPR